jgi:polysaccharide pyruvyl transferase WcaK-like protein
LILLVPHVAPLGDNGGEVENDLLACLETHERLSREYPGRIFVARGRYDHTQVKYIIGKCDFFVGTRMHSCIAALSQGIPAVGLAYSKKFAGVFETVEVKDLVVDMRSVATEEAVAAVDKAFAVRRETTERLRRVIPRVKQQVQALLQDMDSCRKS